ncbi:MAG: hypothetical protein MHPSP_003949, partial [Paramarteilia canceri]
DLENFSGGETEIILEWLLTSQIECFNDYEIFLRDSKQKIDDLNQIVNSDSKKAFNKQWKKFLELNKKKRRVFSLDDLGLSEDQAFILISVYLANLIPDVLDKRFFFKENLSKSSKKKIFSNFDSVVQAKRRNRFSTERIFLIFRAISTQYELKVQNAFLQNIFLLAERCLLKLKSSKNPLRQERIEISNNCDNFFIESLAETLGVSLDKYSPLQIMKT